MLLGGLAQTWQERPLAANGAVVTLFAAKGRSYSLCHAIT